MTLIERQKELEQKVKTSESCKNCKFNNKGICYLASECLDNDEEFFQDKRKKKYRVEFTCTGSACIEVEAITEEEAKEIAEQDLCYDDICLENESFIVTKL